MNERFGSSGSTCLRNSGEMLGSDVEESNVSRDG
jgi:hypothetical protein